MKMNMLKMNIAMVLVLKWKKYLVKLQLICFSNMQFQSWGEAEIMNFTDKSKGAPMNVHIPVVIKRNQ
jgi:hypothetical protein